MSKPQTQKHIKEEKIALNLNNNIMNFYVTVERENITDENSPLR